MYSRDTKQGKLIYSEEEIKLPLLPPLPRQTLYSGLALFGALLVVYFIYLKNALLQSGNYEVTIGLALLYSVAKFILLTGWPFAIAALLDVNWRSNYAAPVALFAYAIVCAYWFNKCGIRCLVAAATLFFPLLFSAVVGHQIGQFRSGKEVE